MEHRDGGAAEREREAMDVRHLRREARTALELALVALAPPEVMDPLATAAGLLEALTELPADSPPVMATIPRALARARTALGAWQEWHARHRDKVVARG